MAGFEFPRDANSGLVADEAVGTSALRLVEGMEGAFESPSMDALTGDMDGWDAVEVLQAAAACAFLKGIDPKTDYDAALVRQALTEQLSLNRDIDPQTMRRRERGPGRR
jgi:hypothetical protein